MVGKDPLPVYWSLNNDLRTITRTGILTRTLTLRLERDLTRILPLGVPGLKSEPKQKTSNKNPIWPEHCIAYIT